MVPVVDNSSFYSSDMDNVTLDARSESCDAVSNTENTAEYEQRVFKGKNKNVVMESGIELRQAAGDDDDKKCCCCTARMCLIIWCCIFMIGAVFTGIMMFLSKESWVRIGCYVGFSMLLPVITMIGALTRNKCLLTLSLIFQILNVIAAIAVAIFSVLFVAAASTEDGKKEINKRCLEIQECKDTIVEMAYIACASVLILVIALVFLIVITVKARKNAK